MLFAGVLGLALTGTTHVRATSADFPRSETQIARLVQLSVRPDHADWTYRAGERVQFHVTLTINRHDAADQPIRYEIGPEMMPPVRQVEATVRDGTVVLDGGTLDAPGFLRCIVTTEIDGRKHRSLATAGFEPEKIQPTQVEPADFDRFWSAGRDELAGLPADAQLTALPELSTPGVESFMVRLRNVGVPLAQGRPPEPSSLYGVLCVPRGPGPYPAVLNVPGAGVRAYRGLTELAERGCITLQIGIHGLPVNLPDAVYRDLATGALADYRVHGADRHEAHYFRRVYLGCLRANDYLTTLPKWDRKNLIVTGGSQGGQLAIVTAALDARVTALAALYPAYCDVTGFLHQRAGGWGHLFKPQADGRPGPHATPAKIAVSGYYDTVNFARRLRVPGFFSWGFNDEICPPTSMFSAYNQIGSPKELVLFLETGHAVLAAQTERSYQWILQQCQPAPWSAPTR